MTVGILLQQQRSLEIGDAASQSEVRRHAAAGAAVSLVQWVD